MIEEKEVELLVERYGSELYKYCLNCLKNNRDAANETLSDIWMVLCRKQKKLDRTRDIKPYLYAVADRCIMKTRRRIIEKQVHEVPLEDDQVASRTGDVLDGYKSEEELLEELEKELPEDMRDVFRMYFIEKKTIREVASAKGITYYRARVIIQTIKSEAERLICRS